MIVVNCLMKDCPADAVCVATVTFREEWKHHSAGPGGINHAPMCAFHCGPGHGTPVVCLPIEPKAPGNRSRLGQGSKYV